MKTMSFDSTSSTIKNATYDTVLCQLDVTFKAGGVYRYRGVSPELVAELENAASPGRWVSANLRKRECVKLQ